MELAKRHAYSTEVMTRNKNKVWPHDMVRTCAVLCVDDSATVHCPPCESRAFLFCYKYLGFDLPQCDSHPLHFGLAHSLLGGMPHHEVFGVGLGAVLWTARRSLRQGLTDF